MASPVKAYIDPTNGVVRQPNINQFIQNLITPALPSVGARQQMFVICAVEQQIVNIGKIGPANIINSSPIPAQVPRPPVGRMLVNTFPSIYKERTGSVGLAAVARVYPPIYIQHTITD